jgi:glycosyltransferase involved in cell wall biosynthesis
VIKLSVVIITYNEEKNIGRCLESVRGLADEIVVVDSHSTDRTRLICEEHGASIIVHDFEGNIQQKNFAISQATYPHQLSLDADEALSDILRNEIKKVKENWQYDGFRMNRMANYCGQWIRHSGWYPDTKLRLYNSTKGEWKGVNPHDKFEMIESSSIGFLKGDILHYTYYTEQEHRQRSDRYSTIAALDLIKRGKPVYFYKILINPFAKFIRNYLLHLGFLDGYYGFRICMIQTVETYQKYKKALYFKGQKGYNPFNLSRSNRSLKSKSLFGSSR